MYAYGRLTQLLRAAETRSDDANSTNAAQYGLDAAASEVPADLEKELLVHVAAFPEVVESAATT